MNDQTIRQHNGKSLIFLDGPAGTQVTTQVIETISDCYKTSNANTHGLFLTTHETDAMMDSLREKLAAFLGPEGPHTISLGQNMTRLNYSLSNAIGRLLQPGDEISSPSLTTNRTGGRGWLCGAKESCAGGNQSPQYRISILPAILLKFVFNE